MKNKVEPEDARPYLWVYAQDGLPLKLILDSGQEFDILSNKQKHHVVIEYKVVKAKKKKK